MWSSLNQTTEMWRLKKNNFRHRKHVAKIARMSIKQGSCNHQPNKNIEPCTQKIFT
jgi:hypothetical protein